MADLPSFADLFRIARDEILARNSRLSRDAVEREGSDANVLVASAVAAADEVVGQLTEVAAALYLDSAQEDALDRLVFDRYGLVRKPAAAAVGTVSFSTTASNPSTFTIPSGTKLQTSGGTQFVTTAAVTFLSGSTGPVNVAVRSLLAGAAQQAKAGAITNIVGQISGQPSDLKVTNAVATAGADDAEADDSLRDRARRFFTTTRRATMSALEAGALAVPGVRTAKGFETLDPLGRPARYVQLAVTDNFTEALVDYSTVPPKYQTQASELAATVFNALDDVRAAGIFVQVIVAEVILQPIQLALTFQAGADTTAVAQQARAAVVNYVNGLAPGTPFVRAAALAALQIVSGLAFTGGEVVAPAGDVLTKPLQALRSSMSLATSNLATAAV